MVDVDAAGRAVVDVPAQTIKGGGVGFRAEAADNVGEAGLVEGCLVNELRLKTILRRGGSGMPCESKGVAWLRYGG